VSLKVDIDSEFESVIAAVKWVLFSGSPAAYIACTLHTLYDLRVVRRVC
jgi:hypothetical protein